MSNDFEKRLDWQIREDVLRLAEQVGVPLLEEQKQKFRRKYFREDRLFVDRREPVREEPSQSSRPKWAIAVAGILLLIVGLTFSQPKTAEALGERLLERIKLFLGGSLYNVNDTRTREAPQVEAPNVVEEEKFQETETTLDKVREEAGFILAEPTYFPGEYALIKVYKHQGLDKYTIKMIYRVGDTEITFIQSKPSRDDSISFLFDSDDVAVRKVTINGVEGYVSQLKDGQTSVKWTLRGLELRLVSTLGEDELLKIANSVR